jgi:thiol-disulfide isomerase/thioredoxin|tara:strand:- start:14 stop:247 length:234 start_codon:yes stop_codon:yes gene_type:complete
MIIKFYTEGCAPCKAVTQVMNSMEIPYHEINIGQNIGEAIKYKVMSVPTLLNAKTGERLVGFKSITHTTEWLNDNQD